MQLVTSSRAQNINQEFQPTLGFEEQPKRHLVHNLWSLTDNKSVLFQAVVSNM